jgi:hypothetical protein
VRSSATVACPSIEPALHFYAHLISTMRKYMVVQRKR